MYNLLTPIAVMVAPVEAAPAEAVTLATELEAIAVEYSHMMASQDFTLTPAQQRDMYNKLKDTLAKYAASGMTLRQAYAQLAKAVVNAGKMGREYFFIIRSWGASVAELAWDVWAVESAFIPGLLVLPQSLQYPGLYYPETDMLGYEGDLVYMYVPDHMYVDWQAYPGDYEYVTGDDGETSQVAFTSTSEGPPASEQPAVKYDSTQTDENGRWTTLGCFPPLPLPTDNAPAYMPDVMVECTATTPDADLVMLDGYFFWAMEITVATAGESAWMLAPADVAGYEMAELTLVVETY